jgi:hypothetical protein
LVTGGGWVGGRDGGACEAPVTAELGHVTPLVQPAVPAAHAQEVQATGLVRVGHGSPSAGWQVAASSLRPARQADPNHPLRASVGAMSSLDETAASVSRCV